MQKEEVDFTNFNNFKSDVIVSSPGRINLIGEHIDYNGGHVLPAAIDLKINLKFKKNDSSIANIWSSNFEKGFQVDLNNIEPSNQQWENYVLGVLFQINKIKPNTVKGFDCILDSKLPIGSGISSSAALECGIAKGLNLLFDIGLTDRQIVLLSRDAEHIFVGTKCGVMDQFAVVYGKKDSLLLLDCNTLNHNIIEANFEPYKLVLLNTNVSHSLADSEYNKRREECDEALQTIKSKYSNYEFLCDVPVDVVKEFKDGLPVKTYNRVLFATQENQRVLMAVEALKERQFKAFGNLMYASHKGLQSLYEVSCKELDFLVDYSMNNEHVLGSRMMGGGFGGCTINLIHQDFVDEYIKGVSIVYLDKFNIELSPIFVSISDGVM